MKKPSRLCMPVNKNGEDPGAPGHTALLLCYRVKTVRGSLPLAPVSPVFANNQFGSQTMSVKKLMELCIPSSLETQ